MQLNLIYVEDDKDDRDALERAVAEHNKTSESFQLGVTTVATIDELKSGLKDSVDIVLADVYLAGFGGKPADRLSELINVVKVWSMDNHLGRPIPIISYTGRNKGALTSCLARKKDLFDIWDKSSASPS